MKRITLLAFALAACGGSSPSVDLAAPDAALANCPMSNPDLGGGGDLSTAPAPDGGEIFCSVDGNLGQCMDATTCSAQPAFSAVPGYCPGPASVQCCVLTPNVANNPPVPAGWLLMQQAMVTPAMTSWAVFILNDPTDYPMFSVALRVFGATNVMARVEWHPPDFQNNVVHRGVTLYTHP
jgi:hypothetical protein